MPKKPKINEEDMTAFHEAVAGTKPLNTPKKVRLARPDAKSKPIRKPKLDDEETLKFSDNASLSSVSGEEFISYGQAGISNKILRKLRKGQYNVGAVLDLHGKTVEEARVAVDSFLRQCLQQEIRVALIIHGKGHHSQVPILKNKLNHWLREINVVLAFCSAAPSHGNRGAMYVLLKNTEEMRD